MQIFKHYSQYNGPWPWCYFTAKEISCKHCGELAIDKESLDALLRLRVLWGKPIIITSGHRCGIHNKLVGGAAHSEHLRLAFDCACPAAEQEAFIELAVECGFTGIGRYPARGFVHLDCGRPRNW